MMPEPLEGATVKIDVTAVVVDHYATLVTESAR